MSRSSMPHCAVPLLALLFTACGSAGILPEPTGSPTVQGTVRTAAGTPARGLTVALSGTALSSTTDAAGQFSLQGAPTGRGAVLFKGPGVDTSVPVARLERGLVVRLSVQLQADGHAELEQEPEAELEGVIASLAAPDLVIGTQTVHTDAKTTFRIGGAAGVLTDLKSGEAVEVEGVLQADGSLLAASVKAEREHAPENEAELKGAISTLAAPDLTVAGKVVHTSAATVIDLGGKASAFADLKVGLVVEVRGTLAADGSVQAASIHVEAEAETGPGGSDDHAVELKGTLALGVGTDLSVAGKTVHTGPGTLFIAFGKTAAFADLKAGQSVEVKATLQADGGLLATQVKVEDAAQGGGEAEIAGTIAALSSPDFTVAGKTVHTTTSTAIELDGRAAVFADLKAGQIVEARGAVQSDGSLLASRIKAESAPVVTPPPSAEVELKGVVSAIAGADLTVAGHLVHTDALTLFDGGGIKSLADVTVGTQVRVRGALKTDGSILAARVQREN